MNPGLNDRLINRGVVGYAIKEYQLVESYP